MSRGRLILSLVVATLLLAGCAVRPPAEEPARDLTAEPDSPLKAEGQVPPMVLALVQEADAASSAGDHEKAAVRLERAIRIAPRNAALWQNLAVVRYRQGRHAQAESLALKSSSLTTDAALKRQNWLLVAAARRTMGDDAGASRAQAEARRLAERIGRR